MARAIRLKKNFADLKKGTVVKNCSNQLAQKLVYRRKVAEFVEESAADAPAKAVAGAQSAAKKILDDAKKQAEKMKSDAENAAAATKADAEKQAEGKKTEGGEADPME